MSFLNLFYFIVKNIFHWSFVNTIYLFQKKKCDCKESQLIAATRNVRSLIFSPVLTSPHFTLYLTKNCLFWSRETRPAVIATDPYGNPYSNFALTNPSFLDRPGLLFLAVILLRVHRSSATQQRLPPLILLTQTSDLTFTR